jgi:hypothetical protein
MPDEEGSRFYRGKSMAGTFRAGDCLTVVPVPLAELQAGDVVVYRGPNGQGEQNELVHRIVAASSEGLVARGDNNPCPDSALVTADNLVGRVTHVERKGRMRPVRGGRWGLGRARLLHALALAWRWFKRLGGRPYRWLRASGLVPRVWHPVFQKIRLATEGGPLVKYVCAGRTVARWWPATGRFECRKPYDLVLRGEDRPG